VIEASVAIAVVALLDDLYDWKFTVKLAAQVLAAVVAVASGIYVVDYRVPYMGPIYIGWLAPPVTVLWLLFATNAMNFIDGLNGLSGGVALIAGAFLAGIAAAYGGWFAYFAALLLVAGLAGFLPFNFPRARIFMGDVGSQFCGFMLAVLAVVASRLENVELSFLLVPMLLSGVLFDVAFTLVRRALAGERLTEPHRGHLYQVAQRSGVPAVTVTLVHWGFAGFGGICALLFLAAAPHAKPFIPLLTVPPQVWWLGLVAQRARRAGVTRWG
jgi:UDP-GlcNAc:undecaprenyl-phosphate GlcNAc-1-phosphate transferase